MEIWQSCKHCGNDGLGLIQAQAVVGADSESAMKGKHTYMRNDSGVGMM